MRCVLVPASRRQMYYLERGELNTIERQANYVRAVAIQPWGRVPDIASLTTAFSRISLPSSSAEA
jgi:hypothetical protein